MQSTILYPRQSALSVLFSRYLNGEIAEKAWQKIMRTFDHEGISATERMAFARFMTEVIDESDDKRLNVPVPDELSDILSDIRSDRN